jgi:hypothetical protein
MTDWKPTEQNIGQPVKPSGDNLPYPYTLNIPKPSNYTCYLFGGDAGFSSITWTPEEGKVPNAWVRFWMKVFFDCKWEKKDT